MSKDSSQNLIPRSPVVAVMGHVDHGKSTLLDYIRKTNVVAGEAGGITQHISAYEVTHENAEGEMKKITFLDTPGHEAFSNMRSRGAKAADVVILVVAADDGVNAQTKEVFETIKESNTPFIVAINKIDKAGANIERAKNSLVENGIYIEGYGGNISCVEISAKNGTGIDDLLETVLLTAELEGFTGNTKENATGIVIESHLDEKRGISATLIIKNGSLEKGMFVVVGKSFSGTRIFEDFRRKAIKHAEFSSPIIITGFDGNVKTGETFYSFETKKEAESFIIDRKNSSKEDRDFSAKENKNDFTIPLIIKTDAVGTGEAIQCEVEKLVSLGAKFKIIRLGVGDISESDLNFAQADKNVLIVGFNVKTERTALDANEQIGATIKTFSIIYELTSWLQNELNNRRPRVEEIEVKGALKVLKLFNATKNKQVLGGSVTQGTLKIGDVVNILRQGEKISRGKIIGLQQGKVDTKEVREGSECGMMLETDFALATGDVLESFIITQK